MPSITLEIYKVRAENSRRELRAKKLRSRCIVSWEIDMAKYKPSVVSGVSVCRVRSRRVRDEFLTRRLCWLRKLVPRRRKQGHWKVSACAL